MDKSAHTSERPAAAEFEAAAVRLVSMRKPDLALVRLPFRLTQQGEPAPLEWRDALDRVFTWLKIDPEFVPANRARSFGRVAGWAAGNQAARSAPVFAPWHGWSPAALQHGGLPSLPDAQWNASYLLEHDAARGPAQCATDVVLMSPLPAICAADEAGGAPLPRAGVLKAMIRAAKAEGRERVAIILQARQRNAIARQLMLADRALTRDGLTLDLLTIEEALPLLIDRAVRWDAIIAMPDVRGVVFTMLAEASGVRGPWPMLWHGGADCRELQLITCEVAGEGLSRAALDAPTLIHALALALHHAGHGHAACRLHEEWARLRDSGVTTVGRGSSAPYVTNVSDAEFIAMLAKGLAPSRRPIRHWRALAGEGMPKTRGQPHALRVIASNPSAPSP